MAFGYVAGKLARLSPKFFLEDLVRTRHQPLYLYDLTGIQDRVRAFQASLEDLNVSIHYAMKANHQPKILAAVRDLGCGVDVVSGGELKAAQDARIPADRVVFSGVAKSAEDIRAALREPILQINVESPAELARIARVAQELGCRAPVAFRMNPDVSPDTHPYIKTGFRENKFGMDESMLPELLDLLRRHPKELNLLGLTLHIGSQLRELSAIMEAIDKTFKVFVELRSQGFDLKTFDVGGGLGIDYHSASFEEELQLLKDYGQALKQRFGQKGELARAAGADPEIKLLFEPGRILVARFGLLLTQVEYIKRTPYKNFAIVNSGMHHLLRPALYQAQHRILPLVEPQETQARELYDVVGPICESADVLGFDRQLPALKEGDWLAVADCGAYGAVMASHYNLHPWPEEMVL